MAGPKVVVLYPSPTDVAAFERTYTQDHVPMVTAENFKGIRKFVASKIVGTPDGSPAPFYRIAELHFQTMEALQRPLLLHLHSRSSLMRSRFRAVADRCSSSGRKTSGPFEQAGQGMELGKL